jgi:hypothetical protein
MNNKNPKFDFSQFPFKGEKKKGSSPSYLEESKMSLTKMDETTKVYVIIIVFCILIGFGFVFLSSRDKKEKINNSPKYIPTAGEEWEEYAPPYP